MAEIVRVTLKNARWHLDALDDPDAGGASGYRPITPSSRGRSRDSRSPAIPASRDKLVDAVGLYMNPPEFSLDEKTQCQSAHSAPEVAMWLEYPRRAHWHPHFTPTSSSWLNLGNRGFKELTERRLRRQLLECQGVGWVAKMGQPISVRHRASSSVSVGPTT